MHIIALDVGSSSMRGVLFSPQGNELLREQRAYSMQTTPDGGVEMAPAVFVAALTDILTTLTRRARDKGLRPEALGLASQRSSVIAVNAHGEPLRPALMWHDKRSAGICEEKNAHRSELFSVCGMPASPVFSAPKMLWLKRHEPHIYAAAHKLVGIHDFLLFQLTGLWRTDASLASRTCLFDIERLEWSDPLLGLFEIDRGKLCDVLPVGAVCGTLSPAMARLTGLESGLPVITAGGDQQCAALGLGSLNSNEVVVNSGTGSYVITTVDAPVFDPEHRLLCNVSAIPGQWIVEGGVLSTGLVYKWFNTLFYADAPNPPDNHFACINAECAASAPGAGGLIMSPCLNGKGAPYWNPQARGSIQNIGFQATRGDFARAVLEGIAAELDDCLTAVQALTGRPMTTIVASGGLTRSEVFNQILADTSGIAVEMRHTEEATARGIWLSAATAMGLYATLPQALAAMDAPAARRFVPHPRRHALYQNWNQARRLLYEGADMRGVHTLLTPHLTGENA